MDNIGFLVSNGSELILEQKKHDGPVTVDHFCAGSEDYSYTTFRNVFISRNALRSVSRGLAARLR